ncbi:MAG: translation initiation inhibitor [Chitinivibrionales bacterium]|nr:translation initiation inhibitor [Chitinivibrionales bacterium]MBD3358082.1 translation initiation inhibitor [Chitinivibrionales bacterium]
MYAAEMQTDSPCLSCFATDIGTTKCHIAVQGHGESFVDALADILNSYKQTLADHGLSPDTAAFSRIYVSDAANQIAPLKGSELYRVLSSGAVSVVEQPPLGNAPLAVVSYHISTANGQSSRIVPNEDPIGRRNGALYKGAHYSMLWTAGYDGRGAFDSAVQSREVLTAVENRLHYHGMNIFDNLLRTWIYVRDIDNHYKGMVESRKAFFEERNLNPDTHYVASTGIEGCGTEVGSLVTVDALAMAGLAPEQIVRMEALENLSPTIKYGVTFERGTRVRFGDRSHLYVSGTASLDKEGKVLHEGNVGKQANRTLDNIQALLAPHGARLSDMKHLLVYLRDFHDLRAVQNAVSTRMPTSIPTIFLKGAVCRPTWLVEMEGTAIIPDENAFPPFI